MELTPLVEWNGINSTRRVEHPGGGGLYYKQYSGDPPPLIPLPPCSTAGRGDGDKGGGGPIHL
jgi:hypothetical protein